MALVAVRSHTPEMQHTFRGKVDTVPAQGVVRVFKPEGYHREQVFSIALNELRQLVNEMYPPEDDAEGS